MEIIIDDREKAVIPFFDKADIPYRVDRITCGDYCVTYNGSIIFIIERKTWCDLAQGFKDGRKENVNKLIELREEHKCIIFYLIEGNPLPRPDKKYSRIPYKNLRSHLDHLMFRDNIFTIHSRDQEDTVDRICELVRNYKTLHPDIIAGANTDLSGLKKKHIKSDNTIRDSIWMCIPFISINTVRLFDNYHISDLILGNISEETLYTMKYTSGRTINTKNAKKIWKGSRPELINIKIFIKMLSCVPGISKKTASIILNKINMIDLFNNTSLCDIQITEKMKLGINKEKKIKSFFNNCLIIV